MNHLETLKQYYFERDILVKYFNDYAPLFSDFMWNQGSHFRTDYFYFFRDEDEFYLVHKDSGTIINWYKHLGRTNTCNKDLSLEELKTLLLLLNDDILAEVDYDK